VFNKKKSNLVEFCDLGEGNIALQGKVIVECPSFIEIYLLGLIYNLF
jgi:hypothetical protein